MAALDNSSKVDEEREERLYGALEKVLGESRRLLEEMRLANRMAYVYDDQTVQVYYQDTAIHIAVPWCDSDQYQRRLMELRMPHDPAMLTQMIDLIPPLDGRSLVDVGGFTGTLGFCLREFLKPNAMHLFEPQKVQKDALKAAIKYNNSKDCPIHFYQDVIDEEGMEMVLGAQPPARLHQTKYLRREGGAIKAKSLDSMDLGPVGMILLDYENDKIGALRGAMNTIERDQPFMLIDRKSRDEADIVKLLEPFNYTVTGIGPSHHLYVPGA